ncbi:MAG: hypothetical protein ACI85O_003133 [Saprospiraceae bacterium]
MLNYLQKYHPTFSKEKLEAQKIHKSIFKETPYKKENIINAISLLRAELKKYLIWKYQDNFPFKKDMIMLQLFKKYNLKPQFDHHLKSMSQEVDNEKLNIWTPLKKMRIEHESYFDPKQEQLIMKDTSLLNAIKNLDEFYILFPS